MGFDTDDLVWDDAGFFDLFVFWDGCGDWDSAFDVDEFVVECDWCVVACAAWDDEADGTDDGVGGDFGPDSDVDEALNCAPHEEYVVDSLVSAFGEADEGFWVVASAYVYGDAVGCYWYADVVCADFAAFGHGDVAVFDFYVVGWCGWLAVDCGSFFCSVGWGFGSVDEGDGDVEGGSLFPFWFCVVDCEWVAAIAVGDLEFVVFDDGVDNVVDLGEGDGCGFDVVFACGEDVAVGDGDSKGVWFGHGDGFDVL